MQASHYVPGGFSVAIATRSQVKTSNSFRLLRLNIKPPSVGNMQKSQNDMDEDIFTHITLIAGKKLYTT